MLFAFLVATIVGFVVILASANVAADWLGILLFVLGLLIALVAVGSLLFAAWGRYLGFSWHFTP